MMSSYTLLVAVLLPCAGCSKMFANESAVDIVTENVDQAADARASDDEQRRVMRGSLSLGCGRRDQQRCPLQQWMHAQLEADFDAQRSERLVAPLRQLASWAPPGYQRWSELASAGARAAAQGDVEQLRQACGDCHRLHRARYRRELRAQPLPGHTP